MKRNRSAAAPLSEWQWEKPTVTPYPALVIRFDQTPSEKSLRWLAPRWVEERVDARRVSITETVQAGDAQ